MDHCNDDYNYNILEGKTAISDSYIGMFPPSNILVYSNDPSIRWISNIVPCDIDIPLGGSHYVNSFDVTFMSHFNSDPHINGWTSPKYDLMSYEIQGRFEEEKWSTLYSYKLGDTESKTSSAYVTQLRLHVTKGLNINPFFASIVEFKAIGYHCALLSNLLCNGSSVNLKPSFSPQTFDYTYIAQDYDSEVTFTPSVNTSDVRTSTIKVDGKSVISGETSKPFPISEEAGSDHLTIEVITTTDVSGRITTKSINYNITVQRSSESLLTAIRFTPKVTFYPEFDSHKYNYTLSTTSAIIRIYPTASDGAHIIVNGIPLKDEKSIVIELNSGENIVTILVTPNYGKLTHTYTFNITRT